MIARLGVMFEFGVTVDAARIAEFERTHDAVFLGIGLGAIHKLGVTGESLRGVTNALDLIEGYKRGTLTSMPSSVVVVGAGNTAIDAAIAAKRLGSAKVYMIYRRGVESISAFAFEYEHARQEGVEFLWHLQPVGIAGTGRVEGIRLSTLVPTEDGSLVAKVGAEFTLPAEMVVLAIGQATHAEFLAQGGRVKTERGRIVIDRVTGQTSDSKIFAGGDCTNGGREVVDAVADGRRAGLGIAAFLGTKTEVHVAHA